MASFGPNLNIPQQAIIDVQGRSPVAEGLQGFIGGAAQGFSANEAIRKLRNRKKATQLLSQRPDLFGIAEGLPPEFLDIAMDHPALLETISKTQRTKSLTATRNPFVVGPDGKVKLPAGAGYSAPEVQAYLRSQQLASSQAKAEQLFQLGKQRLALAKTREERQSAQALLSAAGNIYLQALQPEAYGSVASHLPAAVNTLSGIAEADVSDAEAVQWFRQKYPGAEPTEEDIAWAKEKLSGKR